ncbi:hypothetical protein COO72_06355 [Bifidobacterium callitrichos]|nr:hypothetical protein COO72_06355 [Bifidobacterium callitrichos]
MTGKPKVVQYDNIKALPADMRFSCLSGFNYYALTGDAVTVFGQRRQVVRHHRTGERFYIVPVQLPYSMHLQGHHDKDVVDTDLAHWYKIISRPMPASQFQWPIDLMLNNGLHYLVFPMIDADASWKPIAELLDNVNADHRVVREFAEDAGASNSLTLAVGRSLLTGWGRLLDAGYLYCGFTGNNVFYNTHSGEVCFGFSPAARSLPGFAQQMFACSPLTWMPSGMVGVPTALLDEARLYETVHRGQLNLDLDYLDVAGYNRIIAAIDQGTGTPETDVFSELFTITSVLFRLLVGRLPYNGRIMAPEPNEPGEVHEEWCKTYHRNADFIFDPDNEVNHIGDGYTSPADNVFVRNWEKLPDGVREAFTTVLTQGTERVGSTHLRWCRPSTWLQRLEGFEAQPLD